MSREAENTQYDRFLTAEWTVPERDTDKLDKLIAYARRLGLPSPSMDSFERDPTSENPDGR